MRVFVKLPDAEPELRKLLPIVGLAEMFQQIPFAVMFEYWSPCTSPPHIAEDDVIFVASLVTILIFCPTGDCGGFVQPLTRSNTTNHLKTIFINIILC